MKNNVKPVAKSALTVASKNKEAKAILLLNPKREELSPAILKSFPAYHHLSDAEAEEKCTSIRTFARLLMEYLACDEKTTLIDNQHVISLENNQDNEKRKAA